MLKIILRADAKTRIEDYIDWTLNKTLIKANTPYIHR